MRTERRRVFTKRRVGVTTVALLLMAGTGVGTWLATKSSGAATPLITTTITVQTVSTGTISQTVSASGTVEPADQANLDFGVAGQVTAVNVSVGQTVAVGQPLATINNASLTASLVQAQANLANDQAQLATDQADNASSTQINSDNASIASAETQVANVQTSLSEATLTSTIAGTVAAQSVGRATGDRFDHLIRRFEYRLECIFW